uniref:Thioredoxin domain-containing protein n=1 Tax=Rhabditophanes sp. KR3021 TaxID=114890 RepID=A0AC35U6K8_9BILA
MMMRQNILICLFLFILTISIGAKSADAEEKKDVSHGFNTKINWVSWADALTTAKRDNKPIMMLVHKTWCNACKLLKKSFNEDEEQTELIKQSKKFVMVNLEDDEELEDERYGPDGMYIPRTIFLNIEGAPLAVDNKVEYPHNHYYYPRIGSIIKGMKRAIKAFDLNKVAKGQDSEDAVKEVKKTEENEEKKSDEKKEKKDKKSEEKKEKTEETKEKNTAEKKEKKTEEVKETKAKKETKTDDKKTKKTDEKKTKKSEEKKKASKKDKVEKCPHQAKAEAAKKAAEEALADHKKRESQKKSGKKEDKPQGEKKSKEAKRDDGKKSDRKKETKKDQKSKKDEL